MIVVRPYEKTDKEAIHALHSAQNLGYEEPNWEQMMVSAVIEVDGKIEMAAFLRKTAETYLLLDPTQVLRKRERIGQLLILHKELTIPARSAGLTDIHCWLPPQLESFGKLLKNKHLGWAKAPWPTCYSREVR